jgi:hypothetical protein
MRRRVARLANYQVGPDRSDSDASSSSRACFAHRSGVAAQQSRRYVFERLLPVVILLGTLGLQKPIDAIMSEAEA